MHKITVKIASPVYQRRKEPCMKNELQKITQEWMELERKTSKQRQVAETFYEEKLMSLVVAEFQKNNKNALKEKVDYLIISVGVAYEPLVLSIKYFQPRRILFLYTELTEDTLNKVVRHCSLEAAQYEKHRVHETTRSIFTGRSNRHISPGENRKNSTSTLPEEQKQCRQQRRWQQP